MATCGLAHVKASSIDLELNDLMRWTHTQNSSMSSPSCTSIVFPLFLLPRELRDIVYNHLLITLKGTLENGLRFKVTSTPEKPLMSLCKQFSKEYSEQAEASATLTLSDSITFKADRTSVFLPAAARSISSVQINLFCAPPFITLNHHRQWLGPVLEQLHPGATLNFKIVIRYDASVDALQRILMQDDFWTGRPGLESLEVFRALKGSNALDFAWQTDMVLRWNRGATCEDAFKRFGLNELIEM